MPSRCTYSQPKRVYTELLHYKNAARSIIGAFFVADFLCRCTSQLYSNPTSYCGHGIELARKHPKNDLFYHILKGVFGIELTRILSVKIGIIALFGIELTCNYEFDPIRQHMCVMLCFVLRE